MPVSRRLLLLGIASALPFGEAARASRPATSITVTAARGAVGGTLRIAGLSYPCMLGRSGISANKREGDGATPAGTFALRQVRYRPDRLSRPATALPILATTPSDGWCDAPGDAAYNTAVTLPYAASAERMWRDDEAYDVLAVIGYNDAPPISGLGSAIFLHVMRSGTNGPLPTSGCVSLLRDDLLTVLTRCGPATTITIATTD